MPFRVAFRPNVLQQWWLLNSQALTTLGTLTQVQPIMSLLIWATFPFTPNIKALIMCKVCLYLILALLFYTHPPPHILWKTFRTAHKPQLIYYLSNTFLVTVIVFFCLIKMIFLWRTKLRGGRSIEGWLSTGFILFVPPSIMPKLRLWAAVFQAMSGTIV